MNSGAPRRTALRGTLDLGQLDLVLMGDEDDLRVVAVGERHAGRRHVLANRVGREQQRRPVGVMAAQERDRAVDRQQYLLVCDRQPVGAQPAATVAAGAWLRVGEQHQPAIAGADPFQDLDGAGLRHAAAVGPAVEQRPVDVEHEGAGGVKHGAT